MAQAEEFERELAETIAAARRDVSLTAALLPLAEAAHMAGNEARCIEIVRIAAELSQHDPLVLRGASRIVERSGRFDLAIDLCRRLAQIEPDDVATLKHYASVLISDRQFSRAREQLDIALKFDPLAADCWRMRAAADEYLGEYQSALVASERAVALDPLNAEFCLHRAGLLHHVGRIGEALAAIGAVEAKDGESSYSAWLRSAILDAAGDLDQAIIFARRCLALDPDNLSHTAYLEVLESRRLLLGDDADTPQIVERGKVAAVAQIGFRAALATQWRVIFALLLRDAKTRFGDSRIGYLWAVLEPISHLVLIATVFSANDTGGYPPVGESYIIYYFTGVLPYLLFANTVTGVQQSMKANQSLLQIPLVSHVDVLFSRGLLELLTQFVVAVVMLSGFSVLGYPAMPHDPIDAVCGLFFLWMTAFGIGVINSVMLHFVRSWDHVFGNVIRAVYFTSGIFLNLSIMPPWIRDTLVWNPVLQAVDWVRHGFYAGWEPEWLDRVYLVYWAVGTVTIGFALERAMRRRLSRPD